MGSHWRVLGHDFGVRLQAFTLFFAVHRANRDTI